MRLDKNIKKTARGYVGGYFRFPNRAVYEEKKRHQRTSVKGDWFVNVKLKFHGSSKRRA